MRRPYSVSLPFATASSTAVKVIGADTGPKISSRTDRMPGVTSSSRVGGMYRPSACQLEATVTRALSEREVDVTGHPCVVLRRNERTHDGVRRERVAGGVVRHLLERQCAELVSDRLLDQDPRGRRTTLPAALANTGDRKAGRGAQIGIVSNESSTASSSAFCSSTSAACSSIRPRSCRGNG